MQITMDNRGSRKFSNSKDKEQILEQYSNRYKAGLLSTDIIGKNNFYRDLEFSFDKQMYLKGRAYESYHSIEKSVTGNYFIIFSDGNFPKKVEQLKDSLSIFLDEKQIITENLDEITPEDIFQGDNFYYFTDLGMVFTNLTDEQVGRVGNQKNLFFVEPERIVEAVGNTNSSGTHKTSLSNPDTWGIDYISHGKVQSYTGKGVHVAVIDSGYDDTHPDYKNRIVKTKTYLGTTAKDFYGHGMHCTGIAFGHIDVINKIRYGLAYETKIHAAKILNGNGHGVMSDIILALAWAVKNNCKVALLSVGISNNGLGHPLPTIHRATYLARLNHCIVVAAAGNDSRRSIKDIKPLAAPADAQLSISVGAIDANNSIYNNCNRAETNYGQVMNYVAPGLDIYSSWSQLSSTNPVAHLRMSGTSMAAPYIAGIIALLWEKYPNAGSQKILYELRYNCFKAANWNDERDFGNGVPRLP